MYIEEVLKSWKALDPRVTEEDKVGHLLKGIAEDVYQFLIAKDSLESSVVLPSGMRLASFEADTSLNIDALSNDPSLKGRAHETGPGVHEDSSSFLNMVNKALPSEKRQALLARVNTEARQQDRKLYYDASHRAVSFSSGDEELLHTPIRTPVGAGSAGCALANRLTADGSNTVLLLEAGGLEDAAVQVPLFSAVLQGTNIDWDYRSERQHNASLSVDDQINRFPRGKVLGGSSSINHIIYARGNRKDYDNWVSRYGAEGWSFNDLLPDFISIETSYLGIDNGYHGDTGEVPVSFPSSHTKASDLFLEAGRELGYNNDDYNGPNQTSFSRVQNNIKNGERWSSSKSFITNDVRRRKNFDVALYAHVTKVIFEGMDAVGVEYKRYLGTHTVRAKKEVILCAGAIASAQLLMLSGIGPRDHLQSLGINVIADLPVGENLYDHVTVNGIAASSAENIEINYYLPSTVPKYSLFRTGSKIAVQTLTTQAMKNGNVTIWDVALPAFLGDSPLHKL
ncbi:oxygen-dependent choline dehydrogenase-like [Rhipicephalus sanguineus]|uniref:oxygen-dependent choline dehydrogenase-like n=1 Tax=Rhipicephalus sanguineus TaxID=34632 RepID=UPI0020C3554F|nr:oxygen-dependent choline dehydrogenase-like [Rhipicephalus sanguineus]